MAFDGNEVLKLTATIVAAHVSNNSVGPEAVPSLIIQVRRALELPIEPPVLSATPAPAPAEVTPTAKQRPAVPPEDSVTNEYLICLEDGTKLRTLKRYLRRFNLTPDQYRAKWGLAADYPMTAPAYSKLRRRWAKKLGLGTKSTQVRTARKNAGKAAN